jgi:hypothetical protein
MLYRARAWPRPLIAAALLLTACGAPPSTTPGDYVGEYVFMPRNADPEEFASLVVLMRDRTALELHVSRATGEIRSTKKRWYLDHTTQENVVIGSFRHPIEGSRSDIKLAIDDDLGKYYQKVR